MPASRGWRTPMTTQALVAAQPAEAAPEGTEAREFLRRLFNAAVDSAAPSRITERFLPDKPRGRCVVVGAGKASAAMAAAVDAAWPDVHLSGAVVVPSRPE